MRINTNMAALNAWRTMTNNSGNLQKSLERLASGNRLNRAADDAAGLAVSEKMNAQIRGLGMATRNTQDAISLVQTAEGGASKVQEMMQRMRELAVQAGSDTLQDSDRAKLQEEFSALQAEIDRTTDTVTFNQRKLINGQAGDNATINSGSDATARVTGSLKAAGTFEIDITSLASGQTQTTATADDKTGAAVTWNTTDDLDTLFGGTAFQSGDVLTFAQDGKSMTIDLNATKTMKVGEFVTEVNSKAEAAGMAMRISYVGGATGFELKSNIDGKYGEVTVSEVTGVGSTAINFVETVDSADAAGTIKNLSTGVSTAISAGVTAGDWTLKGNVITGATGKDLQGVEITAAATASTATLELSQNGLSFQVGANTGESISASFGNLTSKNLKIDTATINIKDKSSASTALTNLDTALSTVSSERAKMGATQNRLENTIANLQTQSENLTAANSRIRDLDMASEMAQFTKFQILSQASTAMLAQANQITQGVLSLLR